MRGIQLSGRKVRQRRKSMGLTQQSLAFRSDCDIKTIRKAENSKRVDLATAGRIAVALGVVIGELAEPLPADLRQANIQVAEAWLEAFNARDPDAIAECFHSDGVINILADPSTPGAGKFRGKQRVKEWARVTFATFLSEPITREMYFVDAIGDCAFLHVERVMIKCLLNGVEAPASNISELRIRKGKIVLMSIFPESGAIEGIFHRKPSAP